MPSLKQTSKLITNICKLRYNTFFTSVLLPILLTSAYWLYLISVCPCAVEQYGIYYKIDTIVLTPIVEELVFRGLLLGGLILSAYWFLAKYNIKVSKISVNLCALFISSIIFSLFHLKGIDLRYLAGIIFGAVYLLDKKNLLPAIIAHMINNLLTVYFCSSFV